MPLSYSNKDAKYVLLYEDMRRFPQMSFEPIEHHYLNTYVWPSHGFLTNLGYVKHMTID